MKTLMIVRGMAVIERENGSVDFGPVGMTVDADGSPRCYGPEGTKPLDYLANAGHPGNWWGVATDASGEPVVQKEGDPCPGYYVSTTSYQRPQFAKHDPLRYLDSETARFIVVPAPLRKMIGPVVLGCRGTVKNTVTGKMCECVLGDFGPSTHLGEASMAVAKFFDLNCGPKTGGTEERHFIYTIYPGVAAEGYVLQPA